MWDLPGSGIELVSLALQGGFLITGPPEKSPVSFLTPTIYPRVTLFLLLCGKVPQETTVALALQDDAPNGGPEAQIKLN